MSTKTTALMIILLVVAAVAFWLYEWHRRLPELPKADIFSFFEKDALRPADQALYDSLHAFLEQDDESQARAIFARHSFRYRQIFHGILRQALYHEYRGELVRADPLRRTAEWLAKQFASALNDSFYLAEIDFYHKLIRREQLRKLTLEIFYQKGQQSLIKDTAVAAHHYRQSLRLSQHIGDRRREVDNLLKLKYIYYKGSKYALAIKLARETLQKARAYGYRYREVWARHALGSVLFFNGDYAEAAQHLKKGLALAHELQDELAISNILERLSIAARRMGDFQTAYSSLTEAMELAKKNNSAYDILICYINFGLLYRGMGQYQKAMRYYKKAYALAERLPSRENMALALLDIGYLHRVLGQYRQARAKFLQALDIYIGLKDSYRIATVLKNIGDIHFDERADSTALIYYRRALNELAIALPPDQRKAANRIEGEIRIGIGNFYQRRGEWQKAVDEFKRMRDIFKKKGFKEGQIQATIRLADTYAHMDDVEEALDWYDEAVELAEEVQDPMLLYNAYYSRGRHYLVHERPDLAEQEYTLAIRTIENTRRQLSTDPKMSYFATVQDVYDDMILLQLRQNRVQTAFEFSERARARALYDMLNPAATESDSAVPFAASFPEFADVQNRLTGNAQILEYKLTRHRLLVFILNEQGLRVHESAIERDSLEALVSQFLRSIGADAPDRFRAAVRKQPRATFERSLALGQQLYELLVQPVSPELHPDKVTYIIPDGILSHLPFAALPLPASQPNRPRYWLHETALAYAPSVAVLMRQRQQVAGRQDTPAPKLLAIGNPTGDLKGAESEVRQIARLFSKPVTFIGAQATEARFRAAVLNRFDVLHFATHAAANEENVWGSYLMLGPQTSSMALYRSADVLPEDFSDNVLTVDEILKFDFNGVRLVTLSACETASGRLYRGEGIFGLTQAFIRGGVPTILTSLWKLDDKYTQFLVVQFYRKWQAGASFAGALRQAQLALIQKMRTDPIVQYPFPFAWAGFILVGAHE